MNDELRSIQYSTRSNTDISTHPYVVSDVDLDGAGHEWHTINGDVASDLGATALKQGISIKDVPPNMPRPDRAKMHFVQQAHQRTQKSWKPGHLGRGDRQDKFLHPSVKRTISLPNFIEESVQRTALLSHRSVHFDGLNPLRLIDLCDAKLGG